MIQPPAFRSTRLGLVFIAFVACSTWGNVGSEVMACSCAIRPPALLVDELFEDARAVFVGEPYAVTPVIDANGLVQSVHVDFVVHESWKGVSGSRMGLTTSGDEASCGVDFQVGREYLVFAFASDEVLSANLCSVKDVEAAEDELRTLASDSFEDVVLDEGDDRLFPPLADVDSIDAVSNQPTQTPLCGAGVTTLLMFIVSLCGFHSTRHEHGVMC